MTKNVMRDLLAWRVDGRTVEDWDASWEPVPKAFDGPFSDLKNQAGLIRSLIDGKTKYIMQATDIKGGGIQKVLKRIYKSDCVSPSRYGESLIRQNISIVSIETITVGNTKNSIDITKNLKNLLLLVHDPEWNRFRKKSRS